MPPVLAENTTVAEHIKWRKPRSQLNPPISETTNPSPQIPSIIQSTRCKSTISSLFLSTLSPNNNETTSNKKKINNFTGAKFRGLGCTAAAAAKRVSVPEVIRTAADWEENKGRKGEKKKKKKNEMRTAGCENSSKKTIQGMLVDGSGCGNSAACAAVPDVWCGPGIGFSAADDAAPVECVVARRNVGRRPKIDVEKTNQRERSCSVRRTVTPETLLFLDSDSTFATTYPEPEIFGSRYYRHARHPSPEGFAEIMMLQRSLMRGERLDMSDRYSAWRLDVDNMTYEELLELGDRIGYVSTGLKEDDISRCLRKFKVSKLFSVPSHLSTQLDRKCSICQEEYEADDEIGKLNCGHGYHILCIKQWLAHKNACPVCKTPPVAR